MGKEYPTEVVEAVKKQTRPNRSMALKPQLEPGDNTKFLTHDLRFWDLPKCNMNDEEEVFERTKMYFEACAADDVKPGVAGYALSLGISRQELNNICRGDRGNGSAVSTIKKAKAIIETQMEHYMSNGKINPVSGIFLMKNNYGYTDKQEIEVKATNALGDEVSKDEIAAKYIESLPGDVE